MDKTFHQPFSRSRFSLSVWAIVKWTILPLRVGANLLGNLSKFSCWSLTPPLARRYGKICATLRVETFPEPFIVVSLYKRWNIILTWQDIVVSIFVSVIWKSGRHTAELFLSSQRQFLELPAESCRLKIKTLSFLPPLGSSPSLSSQWRLATWLRKMSAGMATFCFPLSTSQSGSDILPASEDLSSR